MVTCLSWSAIACAVLPCGAAVADLRPSAPSGTRPSGRRRGRHAWPGSLPRGVGRTTPARNATMTRNTVADGGGVARPQRRGALGTPSGRRDERGGDAPPVPLGLPSLPVLRPAPSGHRRGRRARGGLPNRGRVRGAPGQEGNRPPTRAPLLARRGWGSRCAVCPAVSHAHGGSPRFDQRRRCMVIADTRGRGPVAAPVAVMPRYTHSEAWSGRGRGASIPGCNAALQRVCTRSGPGLGGARGRCNAALQRAGCAGRNWFIGRFGDLAPPGPFNGDGR